MENILNTKYDYGMGAVVQKMVFGNKNELSGIGQFISRDISLGTSDVSVRNSGICGHYYPASQIKNDQKSHSMADLKDSMPEIYNQLVEVSKQLEAKERCIQQIEFTVENGKLYFTHKENVPMAPLSQILFNEDLYKAGVLDKASLLESFTIESLKGYGMLEHRNALAKRMLEYFGVDRIPEDMFQQTKENLQPESTWLMQLPSVRKAKNNNSTNFYTGDDNPLLGLEKKVAMILVKAFQDGNLYEQTYSNNGITKPKKW